MRYAYIGFTMCGSACVFYICVKKINQKLNKKHHNYKYNLDFASNEP